jgi:hypothetical protein
MQHDPQRHQQDRLPMILLCLHSYKRSERLAMQNLQIPNTAETRINQSGSFHPAFQTK